MTAVEFLLAVALASVLFLLLDLHRLERKAAWRLRVDHQAQRLYQRTFRLVWAARRSDGRPVFRPSAGEA